MSGVIFPVPGESYDAVGLFFLDGRPCILHHPIKCAELAKAPQVFQIPPYLRSPSDLYCNSGVLNSSIGRLPVLTIHFDYSVLCRQLQRPWPLFSIRIIFLLIPLSTLTTILTFFILTTIVIYVIDSFQLLAGKPLGSRN